MKILLVEDDKKIAKFIRHGFEKENYDVDVAYDGEEGLNLVLGEKYCLVILDVMLTKKDGLTVLREMRERKIHTPVIILSGNNTVDNIVAGLDAGADEYMTKPFAFVELLTRVMALQRRAKYERGAKIFFADLCLDPVKYKVWRNEKQIDLSRKEYELLELFVRHPKQFFSRNTISAAIWGGTLNKFSNVINVYIKKIRDKIEKGYDKKLLHTVRGVGYILMAEEN